MRVLLCVVLMLACVNVSAQHFDVWDVATHPQYETVSFPITFTTVGQARAFGMSQVPTEIRRQLDDFFPIVAVKIALLSEYPSENAVTQSLLSQAVPTGTTVQNEVRYLAAFKREVQLTHGGLQPDVYAAVQTLWDGGSRFQFYYNNVASSAVSQWIALCYKRAVQISATMSRLESQHMAALAANVPFVRDSARVSLQELSGFRLQAGQQNLYVKFQSGDTGVLLTPLRYIDCSKLFWIGQGTGGSATAHVTPLRNPVLLKVGTKAAEVVRVGPPRAITSAELTQGINLSTLTPPIDVAPIANQTVEATTEQTLSYANVFSGQRLQYSVSSERESVATVRLGEAGIVVIRGVAAGNANVRLTATNEAGSATVLIIVTVTPRSE